ncbi:MFS transporter [Aeromicrobium phragmitis]|uniref:Putative proline/betaine transporter n=1 Tax=Aeromicrobium phragmitis TaxID=2478914 RepID=A0A3L8PPE1_9ACTN|nr:MFS transporter [Aeromicrobium phragmitis]RLV57200.1 MFS transporter [Aeromicrobium phragmitis]
MAHTIEPDAVNAPTSKRRSLVASTVGNVLEWYEWSAYAVFAPFIAAVMFSQDDPVSALLSTFAVFAVGFLMRPLGGIVFGRIADRRGRKFVLITTMLMMAGGSFAIGIMPTYESIGAFASLLLLLARMVQGFAHGGESATANTYVAEIAPPNRRGMWGSIVFVAIFGGSVLAYTVGGVITASTSESAVGEWGWRIPFLIGGVAALVVLVLRRGMEESEVFADGNAPAGGTPAAESAPVVEVPRSQVVRGIVLVIAMTSGITAAHYTWTSYVSTYAIAEQGMAASSAYWMSVIAQALALASLPLWGRFSDRVGRRPVLLAFAVAMIVLQFPLMGLISDQPWTLLVAATLALVVVAMPGALLSSTMSEVFPTRVRTQAIGFAYSISVAVFGGSAPYLNQLLNNLGIGWASSLYIVVLCVATGVAVWLLPETKGIDLATAGSTPRRVRR